MAFSMRASANARHGACAGFLASPEPGGLSRLLSHLFHRSERGTTELQPRSLPPNRLLQILRVVSVKMSFATAIGAAIMGCRTSAADV
jgi:hypothetical protein